MYKCPICNKSYVSATDMAQCATKCAQRIEKEANERKLEQLDRDLTNAIDKVREAVDAYNAISTEYHYDFTIHKNKLLKLVEGETNLRDKQPINLDAFKLHGKPIDLNSTEMRLRNFCDEKPESKPEPKFDEKTRIDAIKNKVLLSIDARLAKEKDPKVKEQLTKIKEEIQEDYEDQKTLKEKEDFITTIKALIDFTFPLMDLV